MGRRTAIASAIDSGSATTPTTSAGEQIGAEVLRRVALAHPRAQAVREQILRPIGQRELVSKRLRELVDVAHPPVHAAYSPAPGLSFSSAA